MAKKITLFVNTPTKLYYLYSVISSINMKIRDKIRNIAKRRQITVPCGKPVHSQKLNRDQNYMKAK